MKTLLLSLSLIVSASLYAQTELPSQQVQFVVGRATHGTGDLRGLVYATEYTSYFKKRLSWTLGLGGSIHDGSLPLFYTGSGGETVDASYRYTVSGFQTVGNLGYSFVRTGRHECQFRLGALLRYQSSSYFDRIIIDFPAVTGLPVPVMEIYNRTPQRTYTYGGTAQLLYNYTINDKVSLGVLGGLQTDSNGDTITQVCFTIGRRF